MYNFAVKAVLKRVEKSTLIQNASDFSLDIMTDVLKENELDIKENAQN